MAATNSPPPVVLAIGGSDPTAGAGVQGDLRTIARLGGYGVCAITAVTAQDTVGVTATHTLDATHVAQQLAAIGADLPLAAAKAGMLGSGANVEATAEFLAAHPALPFVLDPVLSSTGGTPLLDGPGREALVRRLLPRAILITPNLPELALLTGLPVRAEHEVHAAARRLLTLGAQAVLVTGGHGVGAEVVDRFYAGGELDVWRSRRLDVAVHGTGCALAAGIATGLATGLSLREAIDRARTDLTRRMAAALSLGRGQRLLP
jgi:hydroxymethylpyrimidine kinase/phosphomethylpyrimidine kinase